MSRVDERIRHEMQRLSRPVVTAGVLDGVSRKRARRRVIHRMQFAALVLAVLSGSVAGGYGLVRLFSSGERPAPVQQPTPEAPTPTAAPQVSIHGACTSSEANPDLNGDALPDTVIVYSWDPAGDACESDPLEFRYRATVALAGQAPDEYVHQDLPECETGCMLFAAPDLDGDARAEIAITLAQGGPAEPFTLYRYLDPVDPGDPALIRLRVAPPGDPWDRRSDADPLFGIEPGPVLFWAYGSVTHIHSVRCEDSPEGRLVMTSTALRPLEPEADPHVYDVHLTTLRLAGDALTVTGSFDSTLSEGDPAFGDLEMPNDLCGATLVGESGSTPEETGGVETPTESQSPRIATFYCDISTIEADVNGDGSVDRVTVWSPVYDQSAETCDVQEVGERYELKVAFGGEAGELLPRQLPECDQPFACRPMAAPDIDGDGAAEVAIRVVQGASTEFFVLYRLVTRPEGGIEPRRMERLEIAPPGDPDFGFPPGPALFGWGGSVTHLQSVRCEGIDDAGGDGYLLVASTATPSEGDPETYEVHETRMDLIDGRLVVVSTANHSGTPGGEEPLPEATGDLCGSPIVAG